MLYQCTRKFIHSNPVVLRLSYSKSKGQSTAKMKLIFSATAPKEIAEQCVGSERGIRTKRLTGGGYKIKR